MTIKCLGCGRPHEAGSAGVVQLGTLGSVCVVQITRDGSYYHAVVRKVREAAQKGTLDVTGRYERAIAEKVRQLLIASNCIAYIGQVQEMSTLPVVLPSGARHSIPLESRL